MQTLAIRCCWDPINKKLRKEHCYYQRHIKNDQENVIPNVYLLNKKALRIYEIKTDKVQENWGRFTYGHGTCRVSQAGLPVNLSNPLVSTSHAPGPTTSLWLQVGAARPGYYLTTEDLSTGIYMCTANNLF